MNAACILLTIGILSAGATLCLAFLSVCLSWLTGWAVEPATAALGLYGVLVVAVGGYR